MDKDQEVVETQREYYDRILKEKDTEIKILEMVIQEITTMWKDTSRRVQPLPVEEGE